MHWALTSIIGLSDLQIRRKARVSPSVIVALTSGRDVSPEMIARLVSLLEWARDQMLAPARYDERDRVLDRREVPAPLRDYSTAVFAAINAVIDDARRPTPVQARQTSLSRDLLSAVATGARRSLVIGSLRREHSSTALRRCAARIGVQEVTRDGAVYWLPPPGAPPSIFEPPSRHVSPPRSPRSQALHDAIIRYLGRQPDLVARSSDVVDAMLLKGFSRPAIFRAARNMDLLRETSGYGHDKRTLWSLPHAPSTIQADDDTPSNVVRVDFSKGVP